MQKLLLLAGAALIIAGLAWPLPARAGLGRLPGDLAWKGPGWSVHFPAVSMIIISLILTMALNFPPKIFK